MILAAVGFSVSAVWFFVARSSLPGPLIAPEAAGYACGYVRGLAAAQGRDLDEADAAPCRSIRAAARAAYGDMSENEIREAAREVLRLQNALLEALKATCGHDI